MKLGVAAQSFGFGPASKAAIIVRELIRYSNIIEPIILANGIAHEFFKREKLNSIPQICPSTNSKELTELCNHLSASVVALDPNWVNFLNDKCPVFFIDSLGFIWGEDFFDKNPSLLKVEKYFVQDIFGAYERLKKIGVPNLVPVGGIIKPKIENLSKEKNQPSMVIHLGGLLNTVTDSSPKIYISFISNILRKIESKISIILASKTASNALEWKFGIIPNALTHAQTLKRFQAATCVLTSPGLTALLELAAIQVPVIPLPPQNMSQAIIIANISRFWLTAPKIWKLLSAEYGDLTGFPEEEGIFRVNEINKKLLKSTSFLSAYQQALCENLAEPSLIPINIVQDFNGVKVCSKHILEALKNL